MSTAMLNDLEVQEALVEARKKKRKKQIIIISVLAAVVIGILVLIWVYGYNYAKNASQKQIDALNAYIGQLEDTPYAMESVTAEIVFTVLNENISQISELATAEYVFTNAAKFTKTNSNAGIFEFMTEKSFIQKWDGKIKAGVKLDNMKVDVQEKTITVTLPAAQILSYEIDYDSVQVLDEKNNIFNRISIEDKNAFDKETKTEMLERATRNGLLDKAKQNAENIITAVLLSAVEHIEEYKIEFVYITEPAQ